MEKTLHTEDANQYFDYLNLDRQILDWILVAKGTYFDDA